MKIREWIVNGMIEAGVERLAKLEEIGAPAIVIDGQKKFLANLENGIITVGGDKDALDDEFVNVEEKVGNGGKKYYSFDNKVNFFPQAKYGMYIKRA